MTDETQAGRGRGSRWSWLVWAGAGALLLTPLVAMQFTDEVNWTVGDFAVMGALLALVCGAWELALRLSGRATYRIAFALAVITAFLLVWVNLAVGVIGDEGEPINLAFFGVVALGVLGALLARGRARGLAWTTAAMALAMAGMAALAPAFGDGRVALLIGIFAGLWLISAGLFGRAARADAGARD